MHSVPEAQALVLQHAQPLAPVVLPLTSAALGLVLAEDVVSDLDMPPYDKAMMDGYALRTHDLAEGRATLSVLEEITAGQVPRHVLGPGQAARIMTGAPVPSGTDAVVMFERTKMIDDNRVQVEDPALMPGKNIAPRGTEMRQGEKVLAAGTVLRPQEFGLLAAVGRTAVKLRPAPQAAILSTGDELVDAGQVPGPGQIRNSNGPMLLVQVCRAGGLPRYLGSAQDRLESLRPLMEEGLCAHVLILSGGVSAGKLDLVPGVLQELGVEPRFHKVTMKPGKPVFFGTRKNAVGPATLVFGLPGNPVSAYVCFELFVRPALRVLAGHAEPGPRMVPAELAEDFPCKTDRPTYYPVFLEENEMGRRFRPCPWIGSADLRALTNSNGFVLFPAGDHRHRAGQRFKVLTVDT